MSVFKPNATSDLLLSKCGELVRDLTDEQKCLDLGTGSGYLLFELSKINSRPQYFGSDISIESINFAKNMAAELGVGVCFKQGSIFEPWKNMKFDLIINDVSGISESLRYLGGWFTDVPCETGENGTDLSLKVFSGVAAALHPEGKFITPYLSLSNRAVFLEGLKNNFKSIIESNKTLIPLPSASSLNSSHMKELQEKGVIEINKSFGVSFFYTSIFVCAL